MSACIMIRLLWHIVNSIQVILEYELFWVNLARITGEGRDEVNQENATSEGSQAIVILWVEHSNPAKNLA